MAAGSEAPTPAPRLEILKALGDNTRYAIYLELARAPSPLATAEIADQLDLHPNTVRPHLERMRDVGMLQQQVESTGAVGRPQHRYSLSADAPSLGLEPPSFPVLARMLLRLAAATGAGPDEAADAAAPTGLDVEQPDVAHALEVRAHRVDVQVEDLGDVGGGQRQRRARQLEVDGVAGVVPERLQHVERDRAAGSPPRRDRRPARGWRDRGRRARL